MDKMVEEAYRAYCFNEDEALWDYLEEQMSKGLSQEEARSIADRVKEVN